jgi:hypothetical protein
VYADDAKLISYINNTNEVNALLTDLNSMDSVIKDWSLKRNKYRNVSDDRKSNIVEYDYFIGNEIMERAESLTDLGMVFYQQLKRFTHKKKGL